MKDTPKATKHPRRRYPETKKQKDARSRNFLKHTLTSLQSLLATNIDLRPHMFHPAEWITLTRLEQTTAELLSEWDKRTEVVQHVNANRTSDNEK